MRLLVIDGNSIANRAFYGIKLLTTKDGRYTWPSLCRASCRPTPYPPPWKPHRPAR